MRQGREVWYQRALWNFWPCHWKGWLVDLTITAITLAAVFGLNGLADDLGHSDLDWIVVLPILAGVAVQHLIAQRHASPRWR